MKHGFHLEKWKKNGENMAFLKALIVNLAVLAVWLIFEYDEFGVLQDRKCDNVVFCVYFLVLWLLFAQKG